MKPTTFRLVTFFLLTAPAWTGCKKETQPDCTPKATADLTFNTYIHPLMSTKCLGCHAAGGITPTLETYAQVQVIVNDGRFKNVISGTGGFPRMPYQSDPLPDCDITYIRQWIDAGAPE